MAQARVLDEELRQGRSRGPLHGRPISIKDLIDVKGVADDGRIAGASRAHRARRRDRRDRLREAGAVIIGKTQSSRIRARHDERRIGIRTGAQPSRPQPLAGRLERRFRGRRGRRHGMGVNRHRHGRIDSHSRIARAASSG